MRACACVQMEAAPLTPCRMRKLAESAARPPKDYLGTLAITDI